MLKEAKSLSTDRASEVLVGGLQVWKSHRLSCEGTHQVVLREDVVCIGPRSKINKMY